IQITGIEGAGNSGIAIFTSNSGTISTTGGAIALIGNSMSIGVPTSIVVNASSSVTLRPLTPGVGIDLGLATDAIGGPPRLTHAELDLITAGTFEIGNASSGPITLSSNIAPASAAAGYLPNRGEHYFT